MKKHTLDNLSKLSMDQVQLFRQVLKGEHLVSVDALFDVSSSQHHGHIQAVRTAMKRLGFDNLIASRCTRERDLVVAMVVAEIGVCILGVLLMPTLPPNGARALPGTRQSISHLHRQGVCALA